MPCDWVDPGLHSHLEAAVNDIVLLANLALQLSIQLERVTMLNAKSGRPHPDIPFKVYILKR